MLRRTTTSGRSPNPLLELISEHQRSAKNRRIADKLKAELPDLIDDQVAEQVQKLEDKFLRNFTQLRKDALEKSAVALEAQLNERIANLERVSSQQTRAVGNLRESLKVAERKVGSVVSVVETALYPQPVNQHKVSLALCPKCMAPQVRRSHRRGLWDEFLRLFFLAPYRCSKCRHKFYRL